MEREEKPSLCCKGCCQGFHQACFDRLEIGPSLAELPGEFSWLCTVCAPLYQLKTVVGGSKGQERPRLKRRGPVVPLPDQPQQPDQGVAEADVVESGGSQTGDTAPADTEAGHQPPDPPPTPPPVSAGTDTGGGEAAGQGASGKDCVLFLSGECPYGISGRTGGICPDKHHKRCMQYMRWGNKSDKGCSGTTCGKSHPKLCPKSLDLRCLDRLCPWKLHTHRCMRADSEARRGGNSEW